MRIWATIRHDVTFQFRHGFYAIYAIISALYVLLLRGLPEAMAHNAATFIIFSDPAALGFFFIGGIVLLERGRQILDNLMITPLQVSEYLLSKVISLAVLSTASSLAIEWLAFGFSPRFQPIPLVVGVVLSSVFFTLVGLAVAARVKSVNHYFLLSPLYTIIFFLPLLDYLNLVHTPLFYLLPSQAALLLIDAAFRELSAAETAYSVIALLLWIAIAYGWAYRSFYRHVVLNVGGDGE